MDSSAPTPAAAAWEQHLVLVLLRDQAGAMERVMGLLRRRATAVTAVSFAPSEEPHLLRVTIALHGARAGIEHVLHQLRKLEDVRSAEAMPAAAKIERDAVVRELVLVRVACDATSRREIVDLAHLFGARAVDVTDLSLTLEMSGDGDTIENLLRLLRPIGIREMARSGKVLLRRDERPDTANAARDEIRATGK